MRSISELKTTRWLESILAYNSHIYANTMKALQKFALRKYEEVSSKMRIQKGDAITLEQLHGFNFTHKLFSRLYEIQQVDVCEKIEEREMRH